MKKIVVLTLLAASLTCSAAHGLFEKEETSHTEDLSDWQVRLELARVLSYQKKYAESIQNYQQVIQQRPEDVEIQLELATVYTYNGDREAAFELLKQIHTDKLSPQKKGLIEKKEAAIYVMLKDYATAEKHFQNYLTQNPEDLQARVKYAEMLSWEKRYEDSLKEYRYVLEKAPDDGQVRRKYALVLIWMGKPEEGADELRKTLEVEPSKALHP